MPLASPFYLIERGYSPGVMSNAFYPLWPILVRLVLPLFGGNALLAGTVLSNLPRVYCCR